MNCERALPLQTTLERNRRNIAIAIMLGWIQSSLIIFDTTLDFIFVRRVLFDWIEIFFSADAETG